MRRLSICAVALVLTACGGKSPTAPSDHLATGTWSGAITTDVGVNGTMTLVLTQNDSGAISGSAVIQLPALSIPNGTVSGGVPPAARAPVQSGLSISVGGPCPATFAAPSTFTTATTLDGSIAGGNPSCGVDLSGRFSLRKA